MTAAKPPQLRLVAAVLAGFCALASAVPAAAQTNRPWMHADVGSAWASGYTGRGVAISVIDDFNSTNRYSNSLMTGSRATQTHGGWTATQAGMVAPGATVRRFDFNAGSTAISLAAGLNVLNLSFGKHTSGTVSAARVAWSAQDRSIISAAQAGTAIIVKSAGNDGVNIGSTTRSGTIDQMNQALIGTAGTIFVGALERHGSVTERARIASYSNRAGTNTTVQNQFLVVGVPSTTIGFQGTSFAAPTVSGYAAVIGSKFRTASPVSVRNQLLNTARTDTIAGYNVSIHGRGEASLSRALAPASIK